MNKNGHIGLEEAIELLHRAGFMVESDKIGSYQESRYLWITYTWS